MGRYMHTPLMQNPNPLSLPSEEHRLVHRPQLIGSLVVSTHEEPQSVGVPDGQPEPHANGPPPSPCGTHTGVPPLHAEVQLPQCDAWETSVSQPLSGFPSQSA